MEAGDGEGPDCLLETQDESPSASAGEPSAPPHANFSSSSAPFLSSWFSKGQADSSLRLFRGAFLGPSAISTNRGCLVPLVFKCWAVLKASESKARVYQREGQ